MLWTSFPLAFLSCHKLSSPARLTVLGMISRALKYTSKPWFKQSFEVTLNHFVKPSDADLSIRLLFQLLFLAAPPVVSRGLSAPAGFSQGYIESWGTGAGSRTVSPSCSPAGAPRFVAGERPRRCVALTAPLWWHLPCLIWPASRRGDICGISCV